MGALTVIPVGGIPEIRPGDPLGALIATAAADQDTPLADRDCLVVTQKVVSKVEGRLVPLDPEDLDARRALVERESVRVLRRRGDLIISETPHGFVGARLRSPPSTATAPPTATARRSGSRRAATSRSWSRTRSGGPGATG